MSLYEYREAVRSLIDRGEWKHSWHLPKDANGYTDWDNPETISQCRSLLRDALKDGLCLVSTAQDLLQKIDWRNQDELEFDESWCLAKHEGHAYFVDVRWLVGCCAVRETSLVERYEPLYADSPGVVDAQWFKWFREDDSEGDRCIAEAEKFCGRLLEAVAKHGRKPDLVGRVAGGSMTVIHYNAEAPA